MPPSLVELLFGAPGTFVAWACCFAVVVPVVVLLHELAHALVAIRLTRSHVLVRLDGQRLRHLCLGRLHIDLALPAFGGVCVHREIPGRYGHAKVAAAGPLASLAIGLAAFDAWRATGWVPLGAFAWAGLLCAASTALPHRFARHGSWLASDGLVVVRALGLVRPPRRDPLAPHPGIRAPFVIFLGLAVAVVGLAVDPSALLIAPLLAVGWFWSVRDRERAVAASTPAAPETWDTAGSKPPPGAR